jgi:hypothetical protein
VSQEPVSYEKA